MKRVISILLMLCAFCVARGAEWSGTGFALKGKYVITNHHVVDGARSLQVRGVRGDFTKMYNAVVVATDAVHDMAIIRIEDSEFTGFGEIPYAIKSDLSEVGEDIFVLGYPMMSTMGEEVKLTTGVISSRSGFMGDISSYQISAPIQPGNSGGPLFDKNGDVVGIVNAKHRQADNAGYAIKSPYMRLFVENSVSTAVMPTNREMVGCSLVDKVKAIKPFVFVIYASGDAIASNSTQYTPPTVREYRNGDICQIGEVIRINGVEGVVFEVTDGGRQGKVVSVKESLQILKWSSDSNEQMRLVGADNEYNGAYNMAKVKQVADWRLKYPAFAWCDDLGESWYLPAKGELLSLYRAKLAVNRYLEARGAGSLGFYWSSTEQSQFCAWAGSMRDDLLDGFSKSCNYKVRAVAAVPLPKVREFRAGDTYKIGDIVRRNGVEGIIFEVTDGGKHGKMISVKESSEYLQWSSDTSEQVRLIGANNVYNGAYNMATVARIADWRLKYPAFAWCANLGEGWYLPATEELLTVYNQKIMIDKALMSRNGGSLRYCWSSTEYDEFCAWFVRMTGRVTGNRYKSGSYYVRAVSAF